MRTIPEPLTVVDLFAGAGGIAEGFRQAGFRVIAGNDSDPDACATFALNFPDAAVVHGDIRDTAVRKAVLEISIGVDVVVGGPPCQAFSQVRNHVRAIDDPRNSLYREFVNIVGALQPNAFLMENVTGIDQMGLREQMENDLSLGGEYSVSPQVIDAADVGVPQTRKRLLFVGVRKSRCTMVPKIDKSSATRIFGLTRAESRGHPFYAVRSSNDLFSGAAMSALSDTEDLSIVTAAQALSDLVSLPAGGRDDIIPYSELPGPQSAYQRYAREGANEASHNVHVPRIRNDTQARLRAIPPPPEAITAISLKNCSREISAMIAGVRRTDRAFCPATALLRLPTAASGHLVMDAQHEG